MTNMVFRERILINSMFSVAPNIVLVPDMMQNAERKHRTQDTNTAPIRPQDKVSQFPNCHFHHMDPSLFVKEDGKRIPGENVPWILTRGFSLEKTHICNAINKQPHNIYTQCTLTMVVREHDGSVKVHIKPKAMSQCAFS